MNLGVNIWDDFLENEGTYIYIENDDISLDEQKSILESLIPKIKSYFPQHVSFHMNLYDTKLKYPNFNRSKENLGLSGWRDWQRWEIRTSAISRESLNEVMYEKKLSDLILNFNQYKIEFYSES